MAFHYAITNLINGTTLPVDNATYRSTEDTLYQVEFMYNQRPSKPFRFTAKAAQWVKCDLGAATDVSLCAVFNHNFTDGVTLALYSAAADAGYALVHTFDWREHDIYAEFAVNNRWFRLDVSDAGNDYYPQIGEWFLGNYQTIADCYIQGPRRDGPQFWSHDHQTAYGQDWDTYLSDNETFSLTFVNLTDPDNMDAFQTFLTDVFENGNRFVMIPDHNHPQAYYCKIVNKDNFANHKFHFDMDVREWQIEVKTLTRGITLL